METLIYLYGVYIQEQSGIGASDVSVQSVCGTINIVTKGPQPAELYHMQSEMMDIRKLHLMPTLVLWIKVGYFKDINLTKQFDDKHQLSLVAFGCPQTHYILSNTLIKSEGL